MKRAPRCSWRRPITCRTAFSANDDFFIHQFEDQYDQEDEDRQPDQNAQPGVSPFGCPVGQGGKTMHVPVAHRADFFHSLVRRDSVVGEFLQDDLLLQE